MANLKQFEVWFITGSQHLYGNETLKQVETHSKEIASALDAAETVPVKIIFKEVIKSDEEAFRVCMEANASPGLRRNRHLVPYIFTVKDVDQWVEDTSKAHTPFAHATQPGDSLVQYRHGFHEFKPGSAWRS